MTLKSAGRKSGADNQTQPSASDEVHHADVQKISLCFRPAQGAEVSSFYMYDSFFYFLILCMQLFK